MRSANLQINAFCFYLHFTVSQFFAIGDVRGTIVEGTK